MRREQTENCVIGDKAAAHPQTGRQRVRQHAPAENLNQRQVNFPLLLTLLFPVLLPDLGLLDVFADPQDDQGGQHAEP